MISFERIDSDNLEQAETFTSWYRDPVMVRNWVLQRESKVSRQPYNVAQFSKEFSSPDKIAFMIKSFEDYIGYGSFYINHPVGMYKSGKTCWPSIGIGNNDYRGKGLGLQLCQEVYRLAKSLDCTHIEAGVFEFNQKIKRLLLRNSFQHFGDMPKMTFVDGRWWSSEHYLLAL